VLGHPAADEVEDPPLPGGQVGGGQLGRRLGHRGDHGGHRAQWCTGRDRTRGLPACSWHWLRLPQFGPPHGRAVVGRHVRLSLVGIQELRG
jgi:hypothetical protein